MGSEHKHDYYVCWLSQKVPVVTSCRLSRRWAPIIPVLRIFAKIVAGEVQALGEFCRGEAGSELRLLFSDAVHFLKKLWSFNLSRRFPP